MSGRAWLLLEGLEVPESWRDRARPVTLIPLLADEGRHVLREGHTGPALEPSDEDLLRFLAGGLGTREIARRTGRPERSVQRHLARLRRRFGAESNAELAVLVAGAGFTHVDDAAAPSADAGNRTIATNPLDTGKRRRS